MDERVPPAPEGEVGSKVWPVGLAALLGVPLALFVLVLAAIKPVMILLAPVVLLSVAVFVVLLLRGDLPRWTQHRPRWW